MEYKFNDPTVWQYVRKEQFQDKDVGLCTYSCYKYTFIIYLVLCSRHRHRHIQDLRVKNIPTYMLELGVNYKKVKNFANKYSMHFYKHCKIYMKRTITLFSNYSIMFYCGENFVIYNELVPCPMWISGPLCHISGSATGANLVQPITWVADQYHNCAIYTLTYYYYFIFF